MMEEAPACQIDDDDKEEHDILLVAQEEDKPAVPIRGPLLLATLFVAAIAPYAPVWYTLFLAQSPTLLLSLALGPVALYWTLDDSWRYLQQFTLQWIRSYAETLVLDEAMDRWWNPQSGILTNALASFWGPALLHQFPSEQRPKLLAALWGMSRADAARIWQQPGGLVYIWPELRRTALEEPLLLDESVASEEDDDDATPVASPTRVVEPPPPLPTEPTHPDESSLFVDLLRATVWEPLVEPFLEQWLPSTETLVHTTAVSGALLVWQLGRPRDARLGWRFWDVSFLGVLSTALVGSIAGLTVQHGGPLLRGRRRPVAQVLWQWIRDHLKTRTRYWLTALALYFWYGHRRRRQSKSLS